MSTATEVRGIKEDRDYEDRIAAKPRVVLPAASPIRVTEPPLFADVLLETGDQRPRRTVATVLSFVFQCSILGAMLLVPLMYTETLPRQQLLSFLVATPPPPPPPPPAAAAAARVARVVESELLNGQLRAPGRIPRQVQMIREDETPPSLSTGGVMGGVPGGIPGGQLGGVIGGIISATSNLSAIPKLATPAAPKRVRISQGVTSGLLLNKVAPVYPKMVSLAHIQGDVVLKAVISSAGTIENLVLVSGHPMLTPAAIDAVKQWRYRPYLLNGEPVEVETTITVTFLLSSG